MKTTTKKNLSLPTVLLLCIGIFAGCSETETYYENEETELYTNAVSFETEGEASNGEIILGEISYIGNSYLSLTTYESDTEITDYTEVDVSALTLVGGLEYVYPNSNTQYYMVSSATLVSAAFEDLTADCMIAASYASDGTQQIIILKNAADEDSKEETASIESDTEELMLPVETYVVAQVSAVNSDGTLTLLNYVSIEDSIEYTIDDFFAADLTQFASDETYFDYQIPEDALIYLVEDETADEITADYIITGDILVIHTDDDGVTNIVVYPAET